MSRQSSFAGRTSRASSPPRGSSGTPSASGGLLASLQARTSVFRDSIAAAGGESPASSLGSSYVLTGGGIAGTARSLLSSFSASGPGNQAGNVEFFEGGGEQITEHETSSVEGLRGLEHLTLGDGGGTGDGLGLYHLQDLEAICGGKVAGDGDRICAKPPAECSAQSHAASRDEDRLQLLVGKVLVKGKATGASKSLYVDPAVSYEIFRAFPGSAELMNMYLSKETWKLIFGELEEFGDGGLAGALATVATRATPARKVRFREDTDEDAGGTEGEVEPEVFVQQVNASFLQIKAAIGMDRPRFTQDGEDVSVWDGLRTLNEAIGGAVAAAGDAKTMAEAVKSGLALMKQQFLLLDTTVKSKLDQLNLGTAAYTTKAAVDSLRGEVNSLTAILGDVVAAVELLRNQRAGLQSTAPAAAIGTIGGPSGPDMVQLERRLEAHVKALIEMAATRLQSKAVACGAESFGDFTEAHQFVLTHTVPPGCEAWMGAVYLMISAETDITTYEESLKQELTSEKTGKSTYKLVQSASFMTLGYAWVARALGLQPTVLCIGDPFWRGYAQSEWPDIEVLSLSEDRFQRLESVLLSDVELIPDQGRRATKFWRDRHVELVIVGSYTDDASLVEACLPPKKAAGRWRWCRADWTVAHGSLGGVTDGSWRLIAFSRAAGSSPTAMPALPAQPLAIFVDQKLPGRPFGDMPAPPSSLTGPHQVRSAKGRPLFSSHGWLRSSDLRQYYVVPSIFSRSCVRQLGEKEMIRAWDVPATVLQRMPPRLYKRFVQGLPRTMPCKVASEGIRTILRWHFDRGGWDIPASGQDIERLGEETTGDVEGDGNGQVVDAPRPALYEGAGEDTADIEEGDDNGQGGDDNGQATEIFTPSVRGMNFAPGESIGPTKVGGPTVQGSDGGEDNGEEAIKTGVAAGEAPPRMVYDSEVGAHYSESLFTCAPDQYRQRIAALTAIEKDGAT